MNAWVAQSLDMSSLSLFYKDIYIRQTSKFPREEEAKLAKRWHEDENREAVNWWLPIYMAWQQLRASIDTLGCKKWI